MSLDDYLEQRLSALDQARRLRDPSALVDDSALDACSNDYLGLGRESVSRETQALGAGASRLIHGTAQPHVELERVIARWVRCPAALLFSSGYAANLGLISALFSEGGLVVSDRANHASIIDGCRLSKAQVSVVPHLDTAAVARALRAQRDVRPLGVVVESYFSMDGDGPDLPALRAVCDELGAFLLVDEAHALGVFGPEGSGRCSEAGVEADALIGGLGKAVGGHGGFVAGSDALRTFLWNSARSFVFSTATSPLLSRHLVERIAAVRGADDRRVHLTRATQDLREQLVAEGLSVVEGSFGPIVPVLLGENERAVRVSARLAELGIRAQAIRPPSVPEGSARLRLTVKSWFTSEDVSRLTSAVVSACRG